LFESVGLRAEEEQAYLTLLRRRRMLRAELAASTGTDLAELDEIIDSLTTKGLIHRTHDAGASDEKQPLTAEHPEVALGRLAMARLEEVRTAQAAIASLVGALETGPYFAASGPGVEVVEGVDAVRRRFAENQRAARRDIRALSRQPVVAVPPAENVAQRDALAAGVRYRVVYDRSLFDPVPERMALMLDEMARLGEEMRVARDVPFKLMVIDSSVAHLIWTQPGWDEATMLQLSSPPLVRAAEWIFDRVWQAALPVAVATTLSADGVLTDGDRTLLGLLLAGYTDQSIAVQLNTSLRTVQRRVHRLLDVAGVQSRIQLGWHAATHGWV